MAVLSTLRGVTVIHCGHIPLRVVLSTKWSPVCFSENVMPELIVKNTYKGVTKVYLCHTRILFQASIYFTNAFFNGHWLEMQFRSIDLKDDLPDVFAFWLKWEYTRVYNLQDTLDIIGSDPVDVLCFFVDAAFHADKYFLEDFGDMVYRACCWYARHRCNIYQIQEAMEYFFRCGGRKGMEIYETLQSVRSSAYLEPWPLDLPWDVEADVLYMDMLRKKGWDHYPYNSPFIAPRILFSHNIPPGVRDGVSWLRQWLPSLRTPSGMLPHAYVDPQQMLCLFPRHR